MGSGAGYFSILNLDLSIWDTLSQLKRDLIVVYFGYFGRQPSSAFALARRLVRRARCIHTFDLCRDALLAYPMLSFRRPEIPRRLRNSY